jgi:two-component system response regulator YesN
MYGVLIVDDEPSAIKSLNYLLDWDKYGFEIAGEAGNGQMALKKMETQSFSLVITDIRMPEMDGIAFIRELRRVSDVPVIIVSGYEDFDYARQAMRYGAKDYLLKPVDTEELSEKLVQVRETIESKALMDKRLYHGLPIMRDQYLRQWVNGYLDDRKFLDELALFLFDDNKHKYGLFIMEIGTGKNTKIRRFAVRNILEELCESKGYVFVESDLRIGMILFGNDLDMTVEKMKAWAEHIHESAFRFTKEQLTISVGPVVSSFEDVVHSYLSALKAMDSVNLDKHGTIIMGTNMEWDKAKDKTSDVIHEVKKMIQNQYARNINLRLLAEQVYLHPAYLGQLFKMHENMTFNQYLLSVRMDKAKQLLNQTDKKIYEIARDVGYRELDWFYKKFKEYTGISASEYRQNDTS